MPPEAPPADPVAATYRDALALRQRELAARERAHALAGRLRFGLAAGAALMVTAFGQPALVWLPVVGAAFLGAVVWHARVLEARARGQRAVDWFERGLARIGHEWIGHGDPGDRFRQADHPYATDLDLFGRGSLFELLSTARTQAGQETIAAWLLSPADPETARARQEAVRELAGRGDLRETMAVEGEGVNRETTALRRWAAAPSRLPAGPLALSLAVLSAANIGLLLWYLTTGALGALSLGVMALQGLAVAILHTRVRAVLAGIDTPTRDLQVVAALLRVLERDALASPRLQALQATIRGHGRSASAEIDALEALVGRLTWRRDMIFGLPAALMLWATQCAIAIDRWRRRAGPRVPAWLDAIGEFEALAALATFAAERPAYAFPTFTPGPAHVVARALAHPLLPASAVTNDVAIGAGHAALLVVSGSNMSGKSTFLRAIGTNVVIAHAGGPVRATEFRLSPLAIGASIHTVDSLQDGRSRFFAEVLRLKLVVDLTRRHPNGVLFLLDEILAGTNSHDRALGAAAVMTGLLREGAIGLVTTHDLALSAIADTLAARAANVHFADEFDAGGLSFDYRLRPGPVRTSNALALMRSIGLEV